MKPFFKTIRNTINHWYLPLIAGVIFILLGIYTLMSPLESYLTLSLIFSISFIISGVLEIFFSISNRQEMENWGWSLFFGLMTFIVGALLIANPAISIVTLPYYVGFLILFRSIAGVSFALDLKSYGILQWGNLMVVAVLGIIFSFILIWNPLFAGLSIVAWTSLALIVAGSFSIYLSIKLKKVKDIPKRISSKLREKWHTIQEEMHEEVKAKS